MQISEQVTMRSLNRAISARNSMYCIVILALMLCFFSRGVLAGCVYEGASTGNLSTDGPLVFNTAAYRMLQRKIWVDDRNFPVDSVMGVGSAVVLPKTCQQLSELRNQRMIVVYVPPSDAVPYLKGYRIPSDAKGVSLVIEFTSSTPGVGGYIVSTSGGTVNATGMLVYPAGRFTQFPVKLTIVKTGEFEKEVKPIGRAITFSKGIGTMRYHGFTTNSVVAASTNAVEMPPMITSSATPISEQGFAIGPICSLSSLGGVRPAGQIYALSAVNTNDFTGV